MFYRYYSHVHIHEYMTTYQHPESKGVLDILRIWTYIENIDTYFQLTKPTGFAARNKEILFEGMPETELAEDLMKEYGLFPLIPFDLRFAHFRGHTHKNH